MIKQKISILLLALVILASCSTDVDLYADYKEVPVVFGLLNVNADTNYIKITKAFCSDNDHPINANEIALIYDSSNYAYKLDACLMELKSVQGQPFSATGRCILLDTLTIHNKKPGAFYSPHQLLYYTDEPLNTNNDYEKYRYRLRIVNSNNDTVTAETGVVSGNVHVANVTLSFQSKPSDRVSSLIFKSTEEAFLYEIGMKFKYRESHDNGAVEIKEVSWSYGMKPLGAFEQVIGDNYRMYYSVNALFSALESAIGNDTVWDVNHPHVVRYADDFVISISAAGEDFNDYYQYTLATQQAPTLSTEYSNIDGGWGLFSSRIVVERTVALSADTYFDLFQKPWGFREE